jgi:putative ABC transport system permease protein
MNLTTLVMRNVRRNRRRTILTVLTVALSTLIFTVLIAVPASMDRIIEDASASLRVMVNNRTGPWYGVPVRYCNDIIGMPGVRACLSLTGWFGTYRDPRDVVLAFAASPVNLSVADVTPDYGISRAAQLGFVQNKRAAWAGSLLMRRNGWKIGQEITLRGTGAGHMELSFKLVGEIPSKHYPNTFIFRRDYLEDALKAHAMPVGDAWVLMVRVADAQQIPAVIREIDDHFHNSDFETRTVTESESIAGSLSAIGDVRGIVYSLCAVVVITMLLIAANSMAMTVRERLGEVAVMRALGFGRFQVAAILFGECALIGALGGILGAGIALAIFGSGATLGAVLSGAAGYLWVSPAIAIEAFGVAVALCVASGLLPVLSAIRTAPAMAFREVV